MGSPERCLKGYPGMLSVFTNRSRTSFRLDNLDRMHTSSVCGYVGEYESRGSRYRFTDCTTQISFFVKRFLIEEREDNVQEKKEQTVSSNSTELATQA